MCMNFMIDKQTLDDLDIFGKRQGKSIFNLFNETKTQGGSLVLEEMFRYSLSDAGAINDRSYLISCFCGKGIDFPFPGELFAIAESYLENTDERSRLSKENYNLQQKIKSHIGTNTEYEQIAKGVSAWREIIKGMDHFMQQLNLGGDTHTAEIAEILAIIREFGGIPEPKQKISYARVAECDDRLRYERRDRLKRMLYLIYRLDVYITVARVAEKRGFSFAKAIQDTENKISIQGLYHPLLATPVANSIEIDGCSNVIFLTGANMAGKSTFMKSFAITMFLAHMGFPVPAESMLFTVQNGMYTTINLSDNFTMGYSHFYSEVLRLKKVAEQVSRSRNLIVIFDELFRGTNLADAYQATVEMVKAFSRKRNCTFIISTHIVEAGEALREKCDNVRFLYLPTLMEGNKPVYTYRLKEGITDDRHGMVIINNEHIVEIIKRNATIG